MATTSPTSVERSVVTETQQFGCESVSSKQVGWQIAVDPVDRGLQTLERTGSLRTFVFKRRQVLQGSTVSANRQCCAASGKPDNKFGQGGPIWDKCLQLVIVCSGHNGISRVLFSDESTFNLSRHDGQFEFLEEKWNVLLDIASLRGTDLEVGVL